MSTIHAGEAATAAATAQAEASFLAWAETESEDRLMAVLEKMAGSEHMLRPGRPERMLRLGQAVAHRRAIASLEAAARAAGL